MFKKLVFVLLMTLLSVDSSAQPRDQQDLTKQLSIPFEKYLLDNGLQVILSVDQSTPFVAVNTWYDVGAISERPHKTGLAHLFEHLMFEGSRHVKASMHFRILEKAGAFDVNASTSFDRTNYYQTVPKNQLELALALESSRMTFLVVNQEKLDEQRAVVRREREQRFETTPYGLASLTIWQSMFNKNHPFYGKVIGSHEDLMAASIGDVQDFYDMHYGPQNACLTLVGDFDINEAKALIKKYYGTLPKGTKTKKVIIPKVSIAEQEIIKVEEKLGKLPLVRIQYLTPALFQQGDAEMDVIAHILTGGQFGRLTKAITRDKPLASAVSAYQQSMDQVSVFTIDAVLNPGADEIEVIEEIDAVLAGLATTPPSITEIERARNSILKNQFFSLQSLGGGSGRAELLQSYNQFANNPGFIGQDIKRYQVVDQKALVGYATSNLAKKSRKILIAKPSLPKVALKGK